MRESGNGETENQVKKPAAYVRGAFQGCHSSTESIIDLPAMPRISSAALALGSLRAASGTFEDEDATIAERDFFGLPGGAYSFAKASAHTLVDRVGFRRGWVPRLLCGNQGLSMRAQSGKPDQAQKKRNRAQPPVPSRV